MDPISHFPEEINYVILAKVDPSSLLEAETVCKAWRAFIHPFLKVLLFSQYYPTISTSEYPSLADRVIFVIDDNLVDKVKKFLVQLEKNQTALFSVVFPFNPENTIQIRLGKKDETNFDRKETLIFLKKMIREKNDFNSERETNYSMLVKSYLSLPLRYFHFQGASTACQLNCLI